MRKDWHDAFHCWIISVKGDSTWLYLQLRSPMKKDYPSLFDITAAGHLLAHETVKDGVREIHEEIGIQVAYEALTALGTLDYCVERGDHFIDKEIAHVFLYHDNFSMGDFTLQEEEVAGMVKVDLDEFASLWEGEVESVLIQGFEISDNGERVAIDKAVGRERFVPHEHSFYQEVISRIKERA